MSREAEVEHRLERLFMRLDFDEGAAIHVIAPGTWLAESRVRTVLLDRLCVHGGWRLLDLRLSPDDDVWEPGRVLAASLSTATSSVLVHVHDDGVDVQRWQPLFRKMNEVRNAILREFPKKLVVLLAPRLVIEFAGEAPDVWSIAAPLVVGEQSPEMLVESMLSDVPALIGLTRRAQNPPAIEGWESHDLAQYSASLRGRQLFELEASRQRLFNFRHARARGGEPNLSIIRSGDNLNLQFRRVGRELHMGIGRLEGNRVTRHEWEGRICCVIRAWSTLDSSEVIELLQTAAEADFVVWVGCYERWSPSIRAGVNLVVVLPPGRAWEVKPGSKVRAPVLQLPVGTEMRLDRAAGGWETVRVWRSMPEWDNGLQLWLPRIDPGSYGEAPLYADSNAGPIL